MRGSWWSRHALLGVGLLCSSGAHVLVAVGLKHLPPPPLMPRAPLLTVEIRSAPSEGEPVVPRSSEPSPLPLSAPGGAAGSPAGEMLRDASVPARLEASSPKPPADVRASEPGEPRPPALRRTGSRRNRILNAYTNRYSKNKAQSPNMASIPSDGPAASGMPMGDRPSLGAVAAVPSTGLEPVSADGGPTALPAPIPPGPTPAVPQETRVPDVPRLRAEALELTEVQTYPRLLRTPTAQEIFGADYPPEARARGEEGLVRLKLRIDESGRVQEALALSGPPLLREAAVKLAWRFQYAPATAGGRPVASWWYEKIPFRIED